jgi:hypothetical protein
MSAASGQQGLPVHQRQSSQGVSTHQRVLSQGPPPGTPYRTPYPQAQLQEMSNRPGTEGNPPGNQFIIYAFKAISPHTREDKDQALQMWHAQNRNPDKFPLHFFLLNKGEIGWVALYGRPEQDTQSFVEVSIIGQTDYGLVPQPGLGYIYRRCLQIRKPKAETLSTSGLLPPLGVGIVIPNKEKYKILQFFSALYQSIKRASGELIEAGFRGYDIDWLSPLFAEEIICSI